MAASKKVHKRSVDKPRQNQLSNIILVLPLLLIYEIGVMFTDVLNGADFITQTILHWWGSRGFLAFQLSILLIFISLALYLRRKQQFNMRLFLPVLMESGIYALTMGSFIVFVMTDLLGIDPRLGPSFAIHEAGFFDKFILSIGAGVYEELVFRLMLFQGLVLVGDRLFKLRHWLAIIIALLISSALFSLAHHLGPLGEPIRFGVFTYRMLAGLFFGALYQFRGFPIAVYTHALYDIYVLLIH